MTVLHDLKEIACMRVPGRSGRFQVADHIRAGAPGFEGVGPKLAELLAGESAIMDVPDVMVRFYLSPKAVDELPQTLFGRRRETVLSWWSFYWFLRYPSAELRNGVHNDGQICSATRFSRGEVIIRTKVNWDTGHNLGGKPSTPHFNWNPGTVFAIPDDQ